MNTIEVHGYSDDIIILTITEDSKKVYEDEHRTNNEFNVNDHFNINTRFGDRGWDIGLTIRDEDLDVNELYKFGLEQCRTNTYSPLLRVATLFSITIDGVYGGLKTKIKNDLRDKRLDEDDVERVLEVLKSNGLLNR